MDQGPPKTPPNPEKIEFKVLRPGDEHVTISLDGTPIRFVLKIKDRIITFGENTGMALEEFGDYFFIDGIYIDETLRGRGITYKLYEEALKLVRSEGKKGLISKANKRQTSTNHIWERFQQTGRTDTVTLGGDKYDVLLR